MMDDFSCCRLIFGEADGLPGLTVDRYGTVLVAQVLSYGMDKIKGMIFNLLYRVLSEMDERIDGLYERNDVSIRALEGLGEYKSWFELDGVSHPERTETSITENGIRYEVDFENGQKTGFFLDQKYNRLQVARLARGKTVLDCFTHTGSFALNAAMGGAQRVTAVDVSQSAIEMAKKNAWANGLDGNMDFLCEDVFDLLPRLAENKKSPYDFIILDPPAFTKSRKTVENASKGYKEINYRAMKLLPRGGFLATCSCSHFMKEELFVQMLKDAASDASVQLKQVEARQQSPDHPILWNVSETDYLKFYIFQII
jgi:23S rRNA (cytosine1962-C5)-methyltransferase